MSKLHERRLGLHGGLSILAACAMAVAAPRPATAQETAPLRIELNRLEPVQGETCRVYLLAENTSQDAYRSLRLDLFAFDLDGVIAKRVALEVGPLAPRKTGVKLFDFAGLPCQRVSRVLLNDVIACEGVEGTRADCLALVGVSSKVARVGFVK